MLLVKCVLLKNFFLTEFIINFEIEISLIFDEAAYLTKYWNKIMFSPKFHSYCYK